MVFNLTHSQIILRYKENGGRIEPYTIVIMVLGFAFLILATKYVEKVLYSIQTMPKAKRDSMALIIYTQTQKFLF
jgi:hypothetical protein